MTDTTPLTEDSPEVRQIAMGVNPSWEQTFPHPRHGALTFKGKLPKASALLEHQIEIDNRLAHLDGAPRTSTMIMVAALAGMTPVDPDQPGQGLLLELPVLAEDRDEDPDTGRVKITRRYYQADDETDVGFLTDVWISFSTWRSGLIEAVDAVKGP